MYSAFFFPSDSMKKLIPSLHLLQVLLLIVCFSSDVSNIRKAKNKDTRGWRVKSTFILLEFSLEYTIKRFSVLKLTLHSSLRKTMKYY